MADPAPAPKKSEKQVMDVSKPGKSSPDASARPVIVGHKPIVQDPMVNSPEDDNPDVVKEEPIAESPANSKRVIAPIAEPDSSADQTDSPAGETVKTPTSKDVATEEKSEEVSETTDSDTAETAVVDAVVGQVGNKREEEQANEEERKKQEAIDKLVAEKKYFVPIGKAHRKRNARWAFIFIIILLLGGLSFLASVDAGLVDVGMEPPFDLIKN